MMKLAELIFNETAGVYRLIHRSVDFSSACGNGIDHLAMS